MLSEIVGICDHHMNHAEFRVVTEGGIYAYHSTFFFLIFKALPCISKN